MTKILLLLGGLASASSAQAASCSDLKSCAMAMSEISGQSYIWNTDYERMKITAAPNLELNKENAEQVFTAMLDQVGLARVPVGDGKTFRLVKGAERKEMEVPVLLGSAEHRPEFPATWDWVTLRYSPKVRELTESMERAYRLHVPREARIQADYGAGIILVTAAAPVVRQMYETLRAADVPQSAAVKKHFEEQERKWREEKKEARFTNK